MHGTPVSFFISYSRRNSYFVDRLAIELETRNILAWVDQRPIESTQPWKDILREAIELCDSMVLVLSPDALLSPQVRMEYCYALDINKPFIGIEYQECAGLPSELQHIRHISYTADTKQGWQELLSILSDKETTVPGQVGPLNRVSYFHKEALVAEAAEDWRKATGFWQALLEEDGHFAEAHQSLERCLRMQGTRAGEDGEWELAMNYWEALLKLQPNDAQAVRQFTLVQHNQEYTEHYRDVEQLILDNMLPLAKTMLNQLYDFAPYYGDALKLGQKIGIEGTIRTPKIFEEEEVERLAQERRKEAEREAQRALERAAEAQRAAEQMRLAEEAERQRVIELARYREQQEREAIRWQEEQARAEAERVRQLAIDRAKRRTPAWFIYQELKTVPFVVWCSCFLLLSGLDSVIGILTQSWRWTIILMTIIIVLAYMLGYHRIVHRRPAWLRQPREPAMFPANRSKSDEWDTMLVYAFAACSIVVLSCITVYCVMLFGVLPLHYNVQHIDHYLWISRTSWLGGQIKLGTIMGAVLSLVLTIVFLSQKKKSFGIALTKALFYGSLITFISWVIISSCGLVFNLGWGLASGWEISLIGLAAGIAGGIGLGSSLTVWAKAGDIS